MYCKTAMDGTKTNVFEYNNNINIAAAYAEDNTSV